MRFETGERPGHGDTVNGIGVPGATEDSLSVVVITALQIEVAFPKDFTHTTHDSSCVNM
jgi:hypothetical protein